MTHLKIWKILPLLYVHFFTIEPPGLPILTLEDGISERFPVHAREEGSPGRSLMLYFRNTSCQTLLTQTLQNRDSTAYCNSSIPLCLVWYLWVLVPVSGRSSAEGPDHSSSVGQCSLLDRMERQSGLIYFLLFFSRKNFTALIPGTTVEILHGDSKNILQLIINAYNVSHQFLLPPTRECAPFPKPSNV